ncbi:uncharacterized protein LOC143449976 isoform X1 [Clavelina lepadiformis]|uniref:uncharacterized protein LOC143449976 isoform X1 n=1 Tax=Clavelina lepadiformis TaxID=159417 RepID=UPI004041CFFC
MNKLVFWGFVLLIGLAYIPGSSAQLGRLLIYFLFSRRPTPGPPPGAERPTCPQCSPNAICNPSSTGVSCVCRRGYTGDGRICTQDVPDVCNCSPFATCSRNRQTGEVSCTCLQGYTGDGRTCDLDGPLQLPCVCDDNADCAYDANRFPVCTCKEGFFGDGFTCTPGELRLPCICGNDADCTFDARGFPQCNCKEGFTGDGFTCLPVQVELPCDICGQNANCRKDDRGFPFCLCNSGFTGDPYEGCTTLPETNIVASLCDTGICGENAECFSNNGRPICTCPLGYIGNPLVLCTPETGAVDVGCAGDKVMLDCANCQPTCADLFTDITCTATCQPGCGCPTAQLPLRQRGDRCIPIRECADALIAETGPVPPTPSCPGNQVYSECAGCKTPCNQRGQIRPCAAICRQECTCPEGLFLNGEDCVTGDQCPVIAPIRQSRCNRPCPSGQVCRFILFSGYRCR